MSNITLGITQCSNVSDPPDPDFVFGLPETLAAGSSATLLGILGLLSNLITICALLLHAPIRCEIFFSPLVPSKREKSILVLLSLYIF